MEQLTSAVNESVLVERYEKMFADEQSIGESGHDCLELLWELRALCKGRSDEQGQRLIFAIIPKEENGSADLMLMKYSVIEEIPRYLQQHPYVQETTSTYENIEIEDTLSVPFTLTRAVEAIKYGVYVPDGDMYAETTLALLLSALSLMGKTIAESDEAKTEIVKGLEPIRDYLEANPQENIDELFSSIRPKDSECLSNLEKDVAYELILRYNTHLEMYTDIYLHLQR